MRKFAFRLQRALRFAHLRESQKKKQVASALQRIAFLEKYTAKLQMTFRQAVDLSTRGVLTLEGEAHRQAILPTLEESRRISALLSEEREALTKSRSELIRLAQRRRSLESLKEKKHVEFRREEVRREQKTIDERTISNRARAMSSNDRD